MGDMGVVVGVTGYLVALVILVPLAGFGSVGFIKPGEGAITFGSNDTNEIVQKQGFGAAIVECIVTGAFVPIVGLIEAFFDIPIVDCSRSSTTAFFQVVGDAFEFGFQFAKFFFQLLFLQVPTIEPLAILIFFHLPGAVLAVVGIRMIRGVG